MRSPGNENGDPAAVRKSEDQVYVALLGFVLSNCDCGWGRQVKAGWESHNLLVKVAFLNHKIPK